MSTLQAICKQFDRESKVPVGTHAHSVESDSEDVANVTSTILKLDILKIYPGRAHLAFRKMRLNPLWNCDKLETREWIERNKRKFVKFCATMREGYESDSEATD